MRPGGCGQMSVCNARRDRTRAVGSCAHSPTACTRDPRGLHASTDSGTSSPRANPALSPLPTRAADRRPGPRPSSATARRRPEPIAHTTLSRALSRTRAGLPGRALSPLPARLLTGDPDHVPQVPPSGGDPSPLPHTTLSRALSRTRAGLPGGALSPSPHRTP
jgi:hypothetical protein